MYIGLGTNRKERGESSTDWSSNRSLGRKGKYRGNAVHSGMTRTRFAIHTQEQVARVNKNGTNPDMFLGCLFLGATNYESPLYAPVYVHGAGLLVHPLSHALIPNIQAPFGIKGQKTQVLMKIEEQERNVGIKLWNSEPEETLKRMCSDGLRNVQICFFRVACLAV